MNLKLWVKVRKEWRDSELYIKNYGYDKRDIYRGMIHEGSGKRRRHGAYRPSPVGEYDRRLVILTRECGEDHGFCQRGQAAGEQPDGRLEPVCVREVPAL